MLVSVSTFLRFALVPPLAPWTTPAAFTAGNARTWHVSDDKQEQFLTDALYMLDVRVRQREDLAILLLLLHQRLLVILLVLHSRPNTNLSCAKLKQQAGGLNSDP